MEEKRLKVLLCCYACDPGHGSEPGMGWNFARNIARQHEVHVIVEKEEFEEKILEYARQHPDEVENMKFYFILKHRHRTLRKIWPPSYYWFYRAWQKKAYLLAQELDKTEHFDLVHHITISGYRDPGYLWKLGKPFVWGPVGGFTDTPWCLMRSLGAGGAIHFGVRNIVNYFQKRFLPRVRQAAARSHTILTSTTQAVREIRDIWHRDAVLMNEVGFENHHPALEVSKHIPGTPLRICWAGEHKPRKALDILLRALPACREKMELHVLSRGPRMQAWKRLAHKLGLDDVVTFHGFVPRDEAFRIMASSHVFCITSVREDTSTVVFEAFRYGLPIIAMDHCGFSAVIDDSCGIKIPINSEKQVISDYARYLDYLSVHEEERCKLSDGALKRCQLYTWDAKMEVLNSIYARTQEK